MTDTAASDPYPFLGGDSKLGGLIRAHDWQKTSLGKLVQWPECLRSAVALILRSDVPMTIQWGAEGCMLYNDAYCDIAGARHPGLLGQTIHDSWSEIADFRAHVVNHVLKGNTLSYCNEYFELLRHGALEDIWLDIDYSPIVDQTGTPAGVFAIVRNTSRQFQSEERLRIAQQAGDVGIFELYPDTGRLEVSDQYRRIWGLPPDTAVTTELLASLVHPDDQQAVAHQRSGMADRLAYAEYRHFDPATGEIRWIARQGEIIAAKGAAERYVGIIMDITHRKASEAALAESEARWRQLTEQMNIKEIRHRNVRTLVSELGCNTVSDGKRTGGMTMLAATLGKSVAQVSRFASEKPSVRIGDRIAREIEGAFGKEPGWMDHVQWSAQVDRVESAHGPHPPDTPQ